MRQVGFLPEPYRFRAAVMGLNLEGCWSWPDWPWSRPRGRRLERSVLGRTGFGDINEADMLRIFVPSLTGITVAIQLGASAFLSSVFAVRR